MVCDEPPPAIPDQVEYGTLLEEYPPLVGELVTAYPLTTIKQMAAAVSAAAAQSYAEQFEWAGLAAGAELGDALQEQRQAASLQQRATAPTSRECRVDDPAAATSASAPQMPDWPPFMLQWVREQRAFWPLSAANAAQLFAGDPDCDSIVRWLQEGVPLLHPGHTVPAFDCPNYPVQPGLAAYTEAAAAQELAERHVAVPPEGVHSPWVHATAAVPKGPAAAPTGARRIHDFARPSGGAVNDHIRYLSRPFMTARQFAEQVEQDGWMAKVDVHAYFHQLPAFPGHWPLLAFRVPAASLGAAGPKAVQPAAAGDAAAGQEQPVEVWGTRVLFGLRHGPEVADRLSQAIVRLMQRMGWAVTYALLDDFNIHEVDPMRCMLGWHFLCAILAHLGLVASLHKSSPPAQVMQTLGLEIDSRAMQIRLTQQRVEQLRQLVADFRDRRQCSKRELDQVVGRLQWASDVIYGGSLLLNPVRRCGKQCRKPHHKVYLRAEARLALSWWHSALAAFNGSRQILNRVPRPWQFLTTDACGLWDTAEPGIGLFVDGGFCGLTAAQCALLFSDAPAPGAPIQLWELFAVVALVRLFGAYLSGQYWQLGVDNSNVFCWLSRGTVRGEVCYDTAMQYLLELFTQQVQLDFRLQPHWIASKTNVLADAASRRDWDTFAAALRAWLRRQGRSRPGVDQLSFLQRGSGAAGLGGAARQ